MTTPPEGVPAGEVKEFDPSGVLEKKEIRRMDRFAQFAVTAAAGGNMVVRSLYLLPLSWAFVA